MQYGNLILIITPYQTTQFKSHYVVWKLPWRKFQQLDKQCLNRTMQYGNCLCAYLYMQKFLRLNRTMQYGNLLLLYEYRKFRRLFKSHYVVWKLVTAFTPFSQEFWFKSHYVVWKRRNYSDNYSSNGWSLNRTMQYGNYTCAGV